jgi:tRNA (guanine37-N1)-methyltransferase
MLKIKVFTLFPEAFLGGTLGISILNRAYKDGLWSLDTVNIRDFATDKHKTTDDTPFGGGSGMVMKPDVLAAALDFHIMQDFQGFTENLQILITCASGEIFEQNTAYELSKSQAIYIICGRYEGIDERFIEYAQERYGAKNVSIGRFVLCGGEVAASVIIEAVVRLIKGVLGNDETLLEESFTLKNEDNEPLLEYPQYTKPRDWNAKTVPEILLSGNHAEIRKWRLKQSKKRSFLD